MVPVPNFKLKGRIYEAGLTQKKLAFALGVSEPYVCNIIGGYQKPSKRFVEQVCLLLNERPAELFPGYSGGGHIK